MNTLSPKLAAEFAHIVYGVLMPDPTGVVRLETTAELDRSFNIDLSGGPVTARIGGLFGLYRRTTGFALHGKGKNHYQGHHVIAIRGTKTTTDWLTNGNVETQPPLAGHVFTLASIRHSRA